MILEDQQRDLISHEDYIELTLMHQTERSINSPHYHKQSHPDGGQGAQDQQKQLVHLSANLFLGLNVASIFSLSLCQKNTQNFDLEKNKCYWV